MTLLLRKDNRYHSAKTFRLSSNSKRLFKRSTLYQVYSKVRQYKIAEEQFRSQNNGCTKKFHQYKVTSKSNAWDKDFKGIQQNLHHARGSNTKNGYKFETKLTSTDTVVVAFNGPSMVANNSKFFSSTRIDSFVKSRDKIQELFGNLTSRHVLMFTNFLAQLLTSSHVDSNVTFLDTGSNFGNQTSTFDVHSASDELSTIKVADQIKLERIIESIAILALDTSESEKIDQILLMLVTHCVNALQCLGLLKNMIHTESFQRKLLLAIKQYFSNVQSGEASHYYTRKMILADGFDEYYEIGFIETATCKPNHDISFASMHKQSAKIISDTRFTRTTHCYGVDEKPDRTNGEKELGGFENVENNQRVDELSLTNAVLRGDRIGTLLQPAPNTMDAGKALLVALKNGRFEWIDALLALKDIDIDLIDSNGATPLHVASANGLRSAVDRLIKRRAKIGALDKTGCQPLHLATLNGHKSVIMALLTRRADVNAKDGGGQTALHLAVRNRSEPCVQLLLKNRADVNCMDNQMCTPLNYAYEMRDTDMARLLLAKGAKNTPFTF